MPKWRELTSFGKENIRAYMRSDLLITGMVKELGRTEDKTEDKTEVLGVVGTEHLLFNYLWPLAQPATSD
jgi:hypothetical protein